MTVANKMLWKPKEIPNTTIKIVNDNLIDYDEGKTEEINPTNIPKDDKLEM